MEHQELVSIAEQWLIRKGCSVTLREYRAPMVKEQPDAIGWRHGMSILIECKTSIEDFKADRKKSFRKHPRMGMGSYRFFLVPNSVLSLKLELPYGWGLLTVSPSGRVRAVSGLPSKNSRWKSEAPFEGNQRCEKLLLLSCCRRMHIRGHLKEVYDGAPWKKGK